MKDPIHITSQDQFSEYKIEKSLGIVCGNTVRCRNFVMEFVGNLRAIFGGEVPQFTKVLAEAREQAKGRMIEQAQKLGADAIVCVRFSITNVMLKSSEILVVGTAVKLQS